MKDYMKDVEALALNIYHEARGENDAGKIAVALATRNRVLDKRWPNNYVGVVWQKKQFSWTIPLESIKGKYGLFSEDNADGHEGAQEKAINEIEEEDVFKKCLEIAASVARGAIEDYTLGANHYHTKAVDPSWSKTMKLTAVIGDHEFYEG